MKPLGKKNYDSFPHQKLMSKKTLTEIARDITYQAALVAAGGLVNDRDPTPSAYNAWLNGLVALDGSIKEFFEIYKEETTNVN